MSIIVYSSFQRKKINPFNARFKAYWFFLDAISKLSTSVNLKCVWLNEINSAYPKWWSWVSKCRSVKELVGEIENTCISLIERVRIWYELHINNFNNPSVYTHVPCLKRHFILLYEIEITQPSTFHMCWYECMVPRMHFLYLLVVGFAMRKFPKTMSVQCP